MNKTHFKKKCLTEFEGSVEKFYYIVDVGGLFDIKWMNFNLLFTNMPKTLWIKIIFSSSLSLIKDKKSLQSSVNNFSNFSHGKINLSITIAIIKRTIRILLINADIWVMMMWSWKWNDLVVYMININRLALGHSFLNKCFMWIRWNL